MWGRMAAAAVTRGTPGGKSRGLSPASPPPRQGAQLHRSGRCAPRRGPPALSRFAPTPRFRPPSPRQGAQLGAGPHGGPAGPDRPGDPRTPAPALPLARHAPADFAPHLLQDIPPCGREAGPSHLGASPGTTAPPWGGRPRARFAPWPAPYPGLRTCALGRSPYPNPGSSAHSRARTGLFPLPIPGHLVEPALRASSSLHRFPQEGGGSGWSQSGRWGRVGLEAEGDRGFGERGAAGCTGRSASGWRMGCPEGG